MSAQSMAEAWAPVDAHYKAEVYKETWGHLAPRRNKIYRGHVTFALGCFGSDYLNPTVLECGIDIDSSPWFFDALIEFLQSLEGEIGGVYRWDGTFRNYTFKGSVRRVPLGADQ
jgi:hypothetical protein